MNDHTNAKLAANVFDDKTIYATINTLTMKESPTFANSVERVFARVELYKCIDAFIHSNTLFIVQSAIKGLRNEATLTCTKKRV